MIRIRLKQDWESHKAGDEINLPPELAQRAVSTGVAITVATIGPKENKVIAPEADKQEEAPIEAPKPTRRKK